MSFEQIFDGFDGVAEVVEVEERLVAFRCRVDALRFEVEQLQVELLFQERVAVAVQILNIKLLQTSKVRLIKRHF